MPFSSLLEFNKWHESIQRRYNTSSAGRTQSGAKSPPFRCDYTTGPRQPREKSRGDAPSPAQWGAAKDQRDGRRMNSNGREVRLSEKSRDAATARLSQQMAKRDEKQEAATGDGAGVLLFSLPTLTKIHSSPTLSCPDDCPSKRFCDPSSCALESVREANAIVEALRRVK